MQSRTSFFNKTLFRNTVSRFLPLWIAYAVIWILILPVSVHSRLSVSWLTNIYYEVQALVLEMGFGTGVLMSAAFGALAAMAVFSYLYTSKSAGMMASLPVRREAMFLTMFSAGLCCLLASNVLVFLITLAVEAAHGMLGIGYLLQWLAPVSMCNVFFYGFASLCAMLTGHILVLPCVYAVLLFTAVVVESIIRYLLDAFVFGMNTSSALIFDFLSPVYYLLSGTRVLPIYNQSVTDPVVIGYRYTGWAPMIIYCAAGVACVAAALLLYRRRRMETASDIVAVKALKPVFKYCLAFGCALCIGTWVYYGIFYQGAQALNVVPLLIFMLFGGFVGYFGAEMLLKKSFRVWRGTWKGFIIFSVIIAALTYAWELDLFGYERRIPDPEEVEYVNLVAMGETTELYEKENIERVVALHSSVVDNKEIHEATGRYWYSTVHIYYYLENGSVMSRSYNLSDTEEEIGNPDSDIRALNDIFNCKEAIASRKEISIPVNEQTITDANVYYNTIVIGAEPAADKTVTQAARKLSDEEAMELYYDCILPDIADGTLGRVWLVKSSDYYDTVYDCYIEISLSMRNSDGTFSNEYFSTVPTVDSVRTNAWLLAHGVELNLVADNNLYEPKGIIVPEDRIFVD